MNTNNHTYTVLGTSLKNIVVEQNMPHGGGTIAERIAGLSVPTGLVYIPEKSPHTISYRSNNPYYTYETISEELYDKLLDLVSVNGTSNKSTSKSRKPKIKKDNTTRRKSII